MAHKNNRAAFSTELFNTFGALSLKAFVTDRQHFVNEQHFGFNVRGNRKAQTHEHTRRIVFNWRVNELFETSKFNNVTELVGDLFLSQTQNRAIHEDVFAPGQFGVEPGT